MIADTSSGGCLPRWAVQAVITLLWLCAFRAVVVKQLLKAHCLGPMQVCANP
jgi:hypothetical protein